MGIVSCENESITRYCMLAERANIGELHRGENESYKEKCIVGVRVKLVELHYE
jgi:hypothetical protein